MLAREKIQKIAQSLVETPDRWAYNSYLKRIEHKYTAYTHIRVDGGGLPSLYTPLREDDEFTTVCLSRGEYELLHDAVTIFMDCYRDEVQILLYDSIDISRV